MTIDYRKLFEAFQRYIDRTLDEMRRCDILREEIEGYRFVGRYAGAEAFMNGIDLRRKICEGYYLYNTVSEENFLALCSDIDNDLWDDYKEMYEPNHVYWAVPLEKYIYALQGITGKRPSAVRHWNHLEVLSASDPAPGPPENRW